MVVTRSRGKLLLLLCQTLFKSDDSAVIVQPDNDILSGFTTLREFRKDIVDRKPISILDALLRSRSSLSTVPQDKLYALLALAFDGKSFIIEPNYRTSV